MQVSEKELRRMANKVLEGVGDARLGEWVERHESIHVRRRLSECEQLVVGPVVDIRGSEEARQRAKELPPHLFEFIPGEVLREEIGVFI